MNNENKGIVENQMPKENNLIENNISNIDENVIIYKENNFQIIQNTSILNVIMKNKIFIVPNFAVLFIICVKYIGLSILPLEKLFHVSSIILIIFLIFKINGKNNLII